MARFDSRQDIDSDEHTVGVDKAVAAEVANEVPASLMPNARVRSPLAVSAAGLSIVTNVYAGVSLAWMDGCNAQRGSGDAQTLSMSSPPDQDLWGAEHNG
jgi:hypothetical protein